MGDVRDGHCLPGLGRVSLQGWKANLFSVAFHPADLGQDPTARLLQTVYRQKAPPLDVAAGAPVVTKKGREHESRNHQGKISTDG